MQIRSGLVGMSIFPSRVVPVIPTVVKRTIGGRSVYIKRCQSRNKYVRERDAYKVLENEPFVPKLISYCDQSMSLVVEDVGSALSDIDINLKDREEELVAMIDTLHSKYGLYHNDLRPKNITLDSNGDLRLIDFEYTSPSKKENPYVFREDKHGFRRIYF